MNEGTSWASMGMNLALSASWQASVESVCIDGIFGHARPLALMLTPEQATDLAKQMLIAVAESQGAPLGGKA